MKSIIIFLAITLLTVCHLTLNAQNKTTKNDTTIYTTVDKFPVLITKEKIYKVDELNEFIEQNKVFPVDPDDCIGRIIISIIVEKDGTVKNKEFVRKLCRGFDENSMKVIDLMKKWKPGLKNGKKVRTKLILNVNWKW
jgi:protein TonB